MPHKHRMLAFHIHGRYPLLSLIKHFGLWQKILTALACTAIALRAVPGSNGQGLFWCPVFPAEIKRSERSEMCSNYKEKREKNELGCIETSKETKQVGLWTRAATQILDHPGTCDPWNYIFVGNLWYLLLALEGVFGEMNRH